MDAAYRNARAYRQEIANNINRLKDQIDRLQAEAGRVDRFLQEWQDFSSHTEHTENIRESASIEPVDKSKREPLGNPSKEIIAAAARDLIAAAGQPVSRNSLYDYLTEARGLTIRGSNPKMVLSTTMWRLSQGDGEFVRLPKFGYWFRDRDYEPAGFRANGLAVLDAEAFDRMTGSASDELERSDIDQV